MLGDPPSPASDRLVSYKLVTDLHLLALARRHGARLATFDRALASAAGGPEDVELVPANLGS